MSLGAARAAMLGASGGAEAGGLIDYSAAVWQAMLNTTLTSGDTVATANTYNEWTHCISTLPILGSVYVEVEAIGFDNLNISQIGLAPAGSAFLDSNTALADSVRTAVSTTLALYGVAYNPTSGDYAIYKDGVFVVSGVVPNTSLDMRIHFHGGKITAASVATINTGATSFTYTPVVL